MTETKIQISKPTQLSPKVIRSLRERAIEFVLFLAASSSVATTIAILYILVSESLSFFGQVPLSKFLTDTEWSPLF